ncbi:hypothetical protein CANARDRAFT_6945 [[Candida] arabinofermentans NRRL YB-2248]|uniref:pyridoxal kinase n=1 Tax=[Candida] arabinofermentans NRRL YB-2248 TaxID=983967 RepID=A0A1E4T491_9ASCO|nr:hypothetical protein CANARDRAFT_6945 [[Candida] arabinofermentans NRRL YB-2248]
MSRDMDAILSSVVPTKNLLSVSSHVVHGKVGNRALQFPLNLRNWNVDCINTTNFSNHPGYKVFEGTKTPSNIILEIFQGLVEINLQYDSIIIGYVSSKENLEIVQRILKLIDYETTVVMDPILGDNGHLYVNPDIISVYKEILSDENQLIDLITPNQFEIETLTDTRINCFNDVKIAIEKFYDMYNVANIVITSLTFDNDQDRTIYCVGATSKDSIFYFTAKTIDAVFSGSGDLFLGFLTDCFNKYAGDLMKSLKETIVMVERVLNVTYNIVTDETLPDSELYIGDKLYLPDLKLVESREALMKPCDPTINVFDGSITFL